jgi:tight adherence protein B
VNLPADMSPWAGSFLAAAGAAGVAYVFLYPLLSGERRAAKRQKALVQAQPDRRIDRVAGVNRREQVAQSLKELEAREKGRNKITLEQRIAQAGLRWTRSRFFTIGGALGLVAGLILFSLTGEILAGAAGAFAGAFGLPRWILAYLKNRRINRFLNELPNAMDIIVRGVRAGLPLGDCFRTIASEAQEPVRTEFRAIMETMAMGVPLSESVLKLYERVPITEANFFAIVISIQQKAGGNLAEAIGNLSKVVRERKKMKSKVAAMSSEAKASAGIIATLPFAVGLMTYLSSPRYIELLWTTLTGRIALTASGVWMIVGVLVMKKMISFKV